jgi:thioredoxin-dependent peroxiredoxin
MRRDFCAAVLVAVLLSLVRGAWADEPAPEQSEAIFSFAAAESVATAASTLNGKMAPDFTLPDDRMNAVRLGELRGKWVVLHFYPLYDTPDCKCQVNDFTRQLQAFYDLGSAVVLGVSTGSPEQLQNLRQQYDLKFMLLSDPQRHVINQYGAWAETTLDGTAYGRVVRGTLVIDPAGRIRRHWPEVMPQGHVERVRSFVEHEILRADQPRTSQEGTGRIGESPDLAGR